jgi:hypothetical protein
VCVEGGDKVGETSKFSCFGLYTVTIMVLGPVTPNASDSGRLNLSNHGSFTLISKCQNSVDLI